MGRTVIARLNKRGMLTLPEEVRYNLPVGTQFSVRQEGPNILLFPLVARAEASYDLSAEASSFANELIAESYGDYVVQAALTDTERFCLGL